MKLDILICGIGGQGVVLLGRFLREFFLHKSHDATISGTESRGVSQREGSVISTVRIRKPAGTEKIGPEILNHGADIIIALEPIELLRNLNFVSSSTRIVLNRNVILPKNVVMYQITKKKASKKTETDRDTEDIDYFSSKQLVKTVLEFLKKIPTITKQDKKHPLLKDQSKVESPQPQLIDFDLSNLMIDEFESTALLNFAMLGLAASSIKELEYTSITKFVGEFFGKTAIAKSRIEKNLIALKFGRSLGQRSKKRKDTQN